MRVESETEMTNRPTLTEKQEMAVAHLLADGQTNAGMAELAGVTRRTLDGLVAKGYASRTRGVWSLTTLGRAVAPRVVAILDHEGKFS